MPNGRMRFSGPPGATCTSRVRVASGRGSSGSSGVVRIGTRSTFVTSPSSFATRISASTS